MNGWRGGFSGRRANRAGDTMSRRERDKPAPDSPGGVRGGLRRQPAEKGKRQVTRVPGDENLALGTIPFAGLGERIEGRKALRLRARQGELGGARVRPTSSWGTTRATQVRKNGARKRGCTTVEGQEGRRRGVFGLGREEETSSEFPVPDARLLRREGTAAKREQAGDYGGAVGQRREGGRKMGL